MTITAQRPAAPEVGQAGAINPYDSIWYHRDMPPRRPMTPDDPRHGTVNGYSNQKCRCDPCKAAKAEETKQYNEANRDARLAKYHADPDKYREARNAYVAANKELVSERQKAWYRENSERILAKQKEAYGPEIQARNRAVQLRRNYGMTVEEYEAKNEAQEGKCAICRNPPQGKRFKRLSVDHCHTTGRVRDLLCNPCNTALGGFRDSSEILAAALEYLAKHADHDD